MKAAWRRIGSIFFCAALGAAGCSRDMAEQPSFKPQGAPRLRSPEESVPLKSRSTLPSPPAPTSERIARGATLFEINCAQCHGKAGLGDGPVGPRLVLLPSNLQSKEVQNKPASELYIIVTNGRIVMPAFKGELSAEERWEVVYFIKSISRSRDSARGAGRKEVARRG